MSVYKYIKKHNKKIYAFLLLFVFALFFYLGISIHTKLQNNNQVVKNINYEAEFIKNTCDKSNDSCYADYFYQYSIKHGYKQSFTLLQSLQQIDNNALNCHFIAHSIGKGAYQMSPESWQNIISEGDVSCSYGLGHGIIETHLASLESDTLLDKKVLSALCAEDKKFSCNHIVGHVLLVEHGGDLSKSLQSCNTYSNLGRTSCQNGVFMEHINRTTLVEHGLIDKAQLGNTPERLKSLVELCNSFEDKQLTYVCWGELSSPALGRYNSNPKSTLEFCSNAPFDDAASYCRKRVIHILSSIHNLNFNSLTEICKFNQPDEPDFEKKCYEEIVYSAVRSLSLDKMDRVSNFCISLSENYQSSCYRQLGAVLKERTSTAQLTAICRSFPKDHQKSCLGNS